MLGSLGPSLNRRQSTSSHIIAAANEQAKKGGSIAFTSSQYLSLASSTDFAFGTSDWTVEMWVRLTALPASGQLSALLDFRPSGTNGNYGLMAVDSSGHVIYNVNNITQITGSRTLSTGTWYNIAWSRNSNSLRQFVGGQSDGLWSGDSTNYAQSGLQISKLGATSSGGITGNITNIRIIKGVGLYPTSAFGISNVPFNPTQNANTVFCMLASTSATAYVDSSVKNKTITNNGTSWSNLEPF